MIIIITFKIANWIPLGLAALALAPAPGPWAWPLALLRTRIYGTKLDLQVEVKRTNN